MYDSALGRRDDDMRLTDLLRVRDYGGSSGAIPSWWEYRRFSSFRPFVSRLKLSRKLEGHEGCVNSLAWNENGTRLLSGSDDTRLKVWTIEPSSSSSLSSIVDARHQTTATTTIETGHATNVFCAKFMSFSNDRRLVSCSADGCIKYIEMTGGTSTPVVRPFLCHSNMTFEVLPDPENPNIFFSCSEDGTVRQFDVRLRDRCECGGCTHGTFVKLTGPQGRLVGIQTITIRPLRSVYLSVGCDDALVRTYDRRMPSADDRPRPIYRFCPSRLTASAGGQPHRITSLKYNHDGRQMIVSYGGDHIYLIEPDSQISSDDARDRRSRWQDKLDSVAVEPSSTATRRSPSPYRSSSDAAAAAAAVSSLNLLNRVFRLRESSPSSSSSTVAINLNQSPSSNHSSSSNQSPSLNQDRLSFDSLPPPVTLETPRVKRPRNGSSTMDSDEPPVDADRDIRMIYCGHRNVRTMIKEASFFGAHSRCVVSGSDDGRVFVWDRDTGDLVNFFTGDKRVVNCVQGHPSLPLLAVSGIDKDIKLFEPLADSSVDLAPAVEIVRRNLRRLDDPQDVLVVPASVVLHLLSMLPGQPANITLTFSSSPGPGLDQDVTVDHSSENDDDNDDAGDDDAVSS